jgi:lysophospholipase L1-like esterase
LSSFAVATFLLATRLIVAAEPTSQPSADAAATKVACVGDSITYGAGIADRKNDSYPVQLGRMLGPEWQVRNFGVSGATLLNKGDRPYTKQKQYQPALEFKPDIVVIMLGTNDSKPQNWSHKDDFVADYKSLIGAFRTANPAAKVYVCLPVPAFPGGYGIREEVIAPDVLSMVKQVASETGATLIDLHTALIGYGSSFPDKIHPNASGAHVMAATVYQALTGKPAPTTQAASTAPAAARS